MAKTVSDIVKYRPKPSLSLDAKDLPEIKNFKIGQEYTLTVKAKVVSLSSGDGYLGDYDDERESKVVRARFQITKVEECEDD